MRKRKILLVYFAIFFANLLVTFRHYYYPKTMSVASSIQLVFFLIFIWIKNYFGWKFLSKYKIKFPLNFIFCWECMCKASLIPSTSFISYIIIIILLRMYKTSILNQKFKRTEKNQQIHWIRKIKILLVYHTIIFLN